MKTRGLFLGEFFAAFAALAVILAVSFSIGTDCGCHGSRHVDDETSIEVMSELAEPPESGAYQSSDPDDPHNWPQWRHSRNGFAKNHPDCMWNGCKAKGKYIHHGFPVSYVVEAGHPEMVYTETGGQTFWALCNDHHKAAHLIGIVPHGSYKATFDPNIAISAKRGKSIGVWPFKSRQDAVNWIKVRAEKSKTTMAP